MEVSSQALSCFSLYVMKCTQDDTQRRSSILQMNDSLGVLLYQNEMFLFKIMN